MKTNNTRQIGGKWVLIFVLAPILLTPFVVVSAGKRGVLMQFGKVEEKILGKGIHVIIPIVNPVKNLSVRVQKQTIEKWDGKLPTIVSESGSEVLNLGKFIKTEES